jgi:hypothetical protein
MPAATSIIAGASAAASGATAIAANKRTKEADLSAKNAAAKLRGISETDYSAGLQVPTMGYDLAQEGVQQQVATGVQALQGAGAAGVIGGLPTLTQQSNQANLELGADLQQQEYSRDLMRAQNRQNIDQRRVDREFDIAAGELEGAQFESLLNREQVNQSVGDVFGAALLGAGEMQKAKDLYKTEAPGTVASGLQQNQQAGSYSPALSVRGGARNYGLPQVGGPLLGPVQQAQQFPGLSARGAQDMRLPNVYSPFANQVNTNNAPLGYNTQIGFFPGLISPFKK